MISTYTRALYDRNSTKWTSITIRSSHDQIVMVLLQSDSKKVMRDKQDVLQMTRVWSNTNREVIVYGRYTKTNRDVERIGPTNADLPDRPDHSCQSNQTIDLIGTSAFKSLSRLSIFQLTENRHEDFTAALKTI
ncbi:hypothetical protein DPMN_147901 [Dreissena polymorpha]|uniref:Uncharacterized protein n=1 Tax=Dreissena polymorpha TaxID=45954 RepID=A0A9D4FBG3_DREPO|nr:hypothetical protein DPMN_147901 [Dreissena polymorpha]